LVLLSNQETPIKKMATPEIIIMTNARIFFRFLDKDPEYL
jgi:hypothetical protein